MNKSVLISIRPEWCEKIAFRQKNIEVRKNRPKIDTPYKCYIYQTKHKWFYSLLHFLGKDDLADNLDKSRGQVIGEFFCNRIHEFKVFEDGTVQDWYFGDLNKSCLTPKEVAEYIGRDNFGYTWRITDLVIYDKPRELREYRILDRQTVKNCPYRSRTGQPEYATKHGGWIKGSYLCDKSETDWCYPCYTKPITRPPQSWCYVEEI